MTSVCVYACVCVFKNAMSVFNYVTLHEDFFFLLEHFGPFRSPPDLMVCVCLSARIQGCIPICAVATMLMPVHVCVCVYKSMPNTGFT